MNPDAVAKSILVGAAVLAGGATAMALKNKKNRAKMKKTLKNMKTKDIELKEKTEQWPEDHPKQTKDIKKMVEGVPGGKHFTGAMARS